MNGSFVAAACQMRSTTDKHANLMAAERLVREAAARGAQFVALPELFNCLGPLPEIAAGAEPIPGPTSERMAALARQLGIVLLAGSICEAADTPGRGYNTSLLIGPDGSLLARYRKMHLFDVEIPGEVNIAESSVMLPGKEVVVTETSLARFGNAVCYDLRFPELFRQMADRGADVLLVPAAFTRITGRHHWELLLRARAVENQCYVVAPNQFGEHAPGLVSWGHTAIFDPWGHPLAQASEDAEEVLLATLDGQELSDIRQKLPALQHRRMK